MVAQGIHCVQQLQHFDIINNSRASGADILQSLGEPNDHPPQSMSPVITPFFLFIVLSHNRVTITNCIKAVSGIYTHDSTYAYKFLRDFNRGFPQGSQRG